MRSFKPAASYWHEIESIEHELWQTFVSPKEKWPWVWATATAEWKGAGMNGQDESLPVTNWKSTHAYGGYLILSKVIIGEVFSTDAGATLIATALHYSPTHPRLYPGRVQLCSLDAEQCTAIISGEEREVTSAAKISLDMQKRAGFTKPTEAHYEQLQAELRHGQEVARTLE